MRRRLGWILAALLSVMVLAAALLLLIYRITLDRETLPPRAGAGDRVWVRHGATLADVARELEERGWIQVSWPLVVEARRKGLDRRIRPGLYAWRRGESLAALLDRMVAGGMVEARVTLPEGWSAGRMLRVVADSVEVPVDLFLKLAGDSARLEEWGVPGPGIEGYLMPDTYRFAKGEEPAVVLGALLRAARAFYRDSLEADAERLGLTRRSLWTLASLIEAEAARGEERPLISAVFWNRLRLRMRLESDPTVLHALGRPPGRVLYKDLAVDSPYNTYRHEGLPPGPICCPGRHSLRAAVRPAAGCKALFFVARGDGSHVFSATLAEHNRARRQISRLVARRHDSPAP